MLTACVHLQDCNAGCKVVANAAASVAAMLWHTEASCLHHVALINGWHVGSALSAATGQEDCAGEGA